MDIPLGKTAIGTCSQCGGPVCVHTCWMSVIPDKPECEKCGAYEAGYGPVIKTVKENPQ